MFSLLSNKVYSAANFAMVEAYWHIDKTIVDNQGGESRAEYGSQLIKSLSEQMTSDFGKGFDARNLSYMRQFYLTFQNVNALRKELSWTHYRMLKRVENEQAQLFYMENALNPHGVHDN